MEAALFAAVVLTLTTKAPMAVAMAKMPSGYDNKTPRAQVAKLEGWGARAAAAHANAWEALLVQGLGLLAVAASGVDSTLAPTLAWSWVGLRVVYTALYVAGFGSLRTVVWGAAFACSLGLMAVAAGWIG